LNLLASGEALEELLVNFQGRLSRKAIEETLRLAAVLLKREALTIAA